jgi:hypothetical protein
VALFVLPSARWLPGVFPLSGVQGITLWAGLFLLLIVDTLVVPRIVYGR